jgi:energy-coupling factor transporter ATP-binding protein EcfA2
MIKNLVIDGLRGFEHFEFRDLGRVNLLVGTNNSGKSTALEAIQLLTNPGDIYGVYKILSRRGEDWLDTVERGRSSRNVDLRRLFFGHEIRKGSTFRIKTKSDARACTFTAQIVDAPSPSAGGQPSLFGPDSRQEDSEEFLSPAAIKLNWDEISDAHFIIPINRRGGLALDTLRRNYAVTDTDKTRLITSAALSADSVVELFESIVLTPDEELVVDALKIIEPSIERIATNASERVRTSSETGRGGIIVRCKGIDSRIPIGSMGDGIWRMLGIALALVRAGDGLLLIDEIDTGLHFSVMADMWRLIYKTAKRLNVQVFATTHSRDCYESLAVICRETVADGSDITIQRIERGKEVAVGYTEQEIIAAAERGMEVR